MSTKLATIYLGTTTADESTGTPRCHVWAQVSIDHRDTAGQTIEHEAIEGYDRVSVSFVLIEARWRITAKRSQPGDFPDAWWVSSGQVSPEERVILPENRASKLSAEQLDLIERSWERWHLNDMRAGCAHMPSWEGIVGLVDDEPADDIPKLYGRTDYAGWALRHVRCAETGYKWGSSWLIEQPPADVLAELGALIDSYNGTTTKEA